VNWNWVLEHSAPDLERDIMAWLSPLDFWKKQNDDTFVKYQERTGKWMLDSKEFNDWCSSG